ncbi:MAG: hypothetical protein DRI23_00350 [Candidatus Cloacimonadota bacterium]|nr:MAG: hypothetical protein DRI23_00350 [Candidatus Cloacimonadota bacterium]
MKYLLLLSLMIIAVSCSESTENDSPDIILGPEDGTYDFYIGLSYSGDQSQYVDQNYFYVIIANETDDPIDTIDLKIEDIDIDLEYANYDGVVFYIAYFYLQTDESFNFKFTVNGEFTEIDVITTPILEMDLPITLVPDEDVELSWYCESDPQTIYVEGFQNDGSNQLSQQGDNLPSNARDYVLPAEWLWSDDNATSRSIQVGIVNHKVVNRIAVAFSDGAYKSY